MKVKAKELLVEIPLRFREQLSSRFDLKNAAKIEKDDGHFKYSINQRCPLCTLYFSGDCDGCQFGKFEKRTLVGCEVWTSNVLNVKEI